MEGIYLIDKPEGITSFDVVRKLRKTLKNKEIGHAGTLDPMATGLLVVLVGKATKLSNLLLEKQKTYVAEITFGFSTDTFDKTGKIVHEKSLFTLTNETLSKGIETLTMRKEQMPPLFAAIKVDGKKLYEYARNNEAVEIQSRPIDIQTFVITKPLKNNCFEALLSVSKGTYIRSIAHDLGLLLEIPSHLSALRRIKSGSFRIEDSYRLDEVTEQTQPSISLSDFMTTLDKVVVEDYMIPLIKNGIRLDERQTTIEGPFVAVSKTGELLALYQKDQTNYKPIIQLGE
ncbi:tRNA pseudouridine55 synthase [Acholeplasma morum]|uniref:tRNA pseudouridine(55) synthase TruB n=1 Tax=Paracholeplasma morum TaxID=264637 RepID=UPI00195A31CF|nr:tRNA pseudouridine(55) synthase TruB [Paracholeplasma morum]MBM7453215.1 tRNA pseudouridine55 synthase [Paracholeplasma morum]